MADCAICDEVVVTHNYVRATFGDTREQTTANSVFVDLKHTLAAALKAFPKERPLYIRWNPREGARKATLRAMAAHADFQTDLDVPESAIMEALFLHDPALGSLALRRLEGLQTSGLFTLTIEQGTKPADVLDIIPWETEKPMVAANFGK